MEATVIIITHVRMHIVMETNLSMCMFVSMSECSNFLKHIAHFSVNRNTITTAVYEGH